MFIVTDKINTLSNTYQLSCGYCNSYKDLRVITRDPPQISAITQMSIQNPVKYGFFFQKQLTAESKKVLSYVFNSVLDKLFILENETNQKIPKFLIWKMVKNYLEFSSQLKTDIIAGIFL